MDLQLSGSSGVPDGAKLLETASSGFMKIVKVNFIDTDVKMCIDFQKFE